MSNCYILQFLHQMFMCLPCCWRRTLKMCCYRSRLVFSCCLKDWHFHNVM